MDYLIPEKIGSTPIKNILLRLDSFNFEEILLSGEIMPEKEPYSFVLQQIDIVKHLFSDLKNFLLKDKFIQLETTFHNLRRISLNLGCDRLSYLSEYSLQHIFKPKKALLKSVLQIIDQELTIVEKKIEDFLKASSRKSIAI